ncbi:unnamed protein product [Tuber melanosporum]|jgi:hypothetical protein|uniref:(Perigord truffle) hypothetical protein n=1 Tax=Tuber melanosporum (strain Mel28) TaxID=656061 RepID=D5GG99_TUBMM|nr:uncharacterized protein GSTUM_00007284001 [Tuber melanosporum]CAZ83542.1 unnamed protein product [Tuber melanosporum]
MVEPQSNNPYRRSMSPQPPAPPAPAALPESTNSPAHPAPLQKSYSATTTIAEEPELEDAEGQARAPAFPAVNVDPGASPVSVPHGPKSVDKSTSDSIVITIHPTSSTCTVQNPPEYPMSRPSMSTHPHPRLSLSCEEGKPCNAWPARRFLQKQVMRNKTKWIIIKVVCAVLFVVGAVAVGLGISHATKSRIDRSS